MISFWVSQTNRHGIDGYLSRRGAAIADRFQVRLYQDIGHSVSVARGAHIFADLDQLTPAQRDVAEQLHDHLARVQPGVPILNDPRKVLCRYELLTRLAEEGFNDFRAFRVGDAHRVTRFPVFVREVQHGGHLTRFLRSPAELRRALAIMRLRGIDSRNLLIVEFCDTSDARGVFRKYSSFRVGERIVPAHVMAGEQWLMKSASGVQREALAREELEYVRNRPHESWLRRVFDLAGIEYGRIDYAMAGDRPQVWEINMNPTIGRPLGAPERHRDAATEAVWQESRELSHELLRDAFRAIDPGGDAEPIVVSLAPDLVARASAEARRIHRHARVAAGIQRLQDHTLLRPLRLAFRRVVGSIGLPGHP